MLTASITTINSAMKRCEETRSLLSNALASYLDSCVALEATLLPGYGSMDPKDIASRIDSTIDFLQHDMAQQFRRSFAVLARTRNRFVSSTRNLPGEVLFEVFSHVIYTPEAKNMTMKRCLWATYSSLYNLMEVCSVWRNFALTQGLFWDTVPTYGQYVNYPATHLGVQRAGNRGLRLAAILSEGKTPRFLEALKSYSSRFRALNVESKDLRGVRGLLSRLLQDGAPLSEVSVHYNPDRFSKHELVYSAVIHSVPLDRAFLTKLTKSLTVLRLYQCHLRWENAAFSDKLVELVIFGVRLGNSGSAMAKFLLAISSAGELRHLKLAQLTACRNPAETAGFAALPNNILPKLQSLVLEDNSFNVLEDVLLAIAPGSYHLTLCLTQLALEIEYLYIDRSSLKKTEFDNLAILLSRVKIDRLFLESILGGYNDGLKGSELRRLLASVPRLEQLSIYEIEFNTDFCNGLFSTSDLERGGIPFPRVEVLDLTSTVIFDVEGFKRFPLNIPIQKMTLSKGFYTHNERGLVKWLECNIPEFCVVAEAYLPVVDRHVQWPFW